MEGAEEAPEKSVSRECVTIPQELGSNLFLISEQTIDGALDLPGLSPGHVGVDDRGADLGVAQKLLDVPEVGPRLQEMSGK